MLNTIIYLVNANGKMTLKLPKFLSVLKEMQILLKMGSLGGWNVEEEEVCSQGDDHGGGVSGFPSHGRCADTELKQHNASPPEIPLWWASCRIQDAVLVLYRNMFKGRFRGREGRNCFC